MITLLRRITSTSVFAVLGFLTVLPSNAQVTSFSYESASGTWVTRGWDIEIGPEDNWDFSVGRIFTTGYSISMDNQNSGSSGSIYPGQSYDLWFEAPDGGLLTPGLYSGASRFPFNDSGTPGFDISSTGRGNNMIDGSFEVFEATYDASDNLLSFSADFSVIEEDDPARWINGSIRFNASAIPEPGSLAIVSLCSLACFVPRRRVGC